LVQQLVNEVAGMPGALPLLSFALYEMYRHFAQRYVESEKAKELIKREITWEDYESLDGGVQKALTRRATEEYERLAKDDEGKPLKKSEARACKTMLRWVMLRMVTLDGGEIARRRVFESELEHVDGKNNAHCQLVIQRFVDARLLVKAEEYVEPAHDALILNWEKLREWIEEEKENLILRDRLIPAVRDWEQGTAQIQSANWALWLWCSLGDLINFVIEQGMRLERFQQSVIKAIVRSIRLQPENNKQQKSADYLWHNNSRLEQLRGFLYSRKSWLNAAEIKFVRQSVIRKGRNRIIWETVSFVVFIAIVYLGCKAWWEENQTKIGKVRVLRESAEGNLVTNRQIEAAINILKAERTLSSIWWQLDPHLETQVKSTLYKILYATQERNRLQLDRGSLYEVVFNPNPHQEQLATIGEGGTVRLWNSKGDELAPLITEQKGVYSVAFRYDSKKPDSTVLATAGADGKVKFWDIQQDGSSTSCAIDSANKDNSHCSIKTIDLANGNKEIDIDDVEFSADGKLLAIVEHDLNSEDHHVKLWNLVEQKGKEIQAYTLEETKDSPSTPLGKENVYQDIAFMPPTKKIQGNNSNVLATVGEGDVVKLWNVTSGKKHGEINTQQLGEINTQQLGEINTQQGYVYSVTFNKDGILMTGGADGKVKRWRIEPQDNTQSNTSQQVIFTPDALDRIETKQKNVYAVAVSPKDKLATIGEDDVVQLWDNNGKFIHDKIQPLEGSLSDSKTRSVAFRPDGERLATIGGDNTIRLWDTAGKRIRRFGDVPEQMENVVFSPDGKLLATVGTRRADNAQDKEKNILRLWDAGTGEDIDSVVSPFNFKSLVFLPDPPKKQPLPGQPIAAIKDDGTVYILFSDPKNYFRFAKKNGTLIALEAGKFYQDYLSKNKIERLTFSANFTYEGIIYTPTPNEKDKSKQLIQLRRSGNNRPVDLRLENPGSMALSADGQRFAIARTDGVVQLWNTDKLFANTNTFSNKPDIELQTQQGNITGLAFYPSDNDRLVTGGADGTVRLWDLSRNKPTQLPLLRDGELKTATASANGNRLATLSKEGILNLWDAKDGTPVEQLNQHQKRLEQAKTITLSSTGKYIAIICKDGSVSLWDTEKDNFTKFIPANPNNQVRSIEFAPDNARLVAIRKMGGIEVWKLSEDGQLSQDLDKQANQPISLLNTNRERLNNEQDIVSASFNPKNSSDLTTLYADTTVLATLGKDGTVKLWNAKDECIRTFKTDQKEPRIIAFSPDGTRLATGAAEDDKTEGTVRVWDTKGRQIQQFGVGLGDVKSMNFSNDAQKLAIIAKKECPQQDTNQGVSEKRCGEEDMS
jgi:WD40 repeat protein